VPRLRVRLRADQRAADHRRGGRHGAGPRGAAARPAGQPEGPGQAAVPGRAAVAAARPRRVRHLGLDRHPAAAAARHGGAGQRLATRRAQPDRRQPDHCSRAGGRGRRRRHRVAGPRGYRLVEREPVMSPTWYLVLSAVLFTIGTIGVLVRRNAIVVFMCIELMFNAVNLTLVTFSRINGTLDGQIMAFFVMVVAAAEVVVGLAIIMAIFRTRRSASIDDANLLKY